MLNPKQKNCIKFMLEGNMTQKEMASALGVSENTICNWKKNEEFTSAYTTSLKDSIKEVAATAFQTERKLLMARSEMVRLLAAKDILDRAGFKADEKLMLETNQKVVIVDDLDEE